MSAYTTNEILKSILSMRVLGALFVALYYWQIILWLKIPIAQLFWRLELFRTHIVHLFEKGFVLFFDDVDQQLESYF
jgi:hypothetical protein